MTVAEAVLYFVSIAPATIPSFDALVSMVTIYCPAASATEIDAAARPFEVGPPGAYRYERDGGPGHCINVDAGAAGGR